MSLVYLDSSIIIYAIEGDPELRRRVTDLLSRQSGVLEPAVCRLSLLECRVKPLREKRETVLAQYEDFFARTDLITLEIDAEVVETATTLCALHGFKTPDAIHLAAALVANVDVFVTADKHLTNCPGLRVELFSM